MTETSQHLPPLVPLPAARSAPVQLKADPSRFEQLTPGPQENPDAPPAPFSTRTSAQRAQDAADAIAWFESDEYKENARRF